MCEPGRHCFVTIEGLQLSLRPMQLKDFAEIEKATKSGRKEFFRLGLGLIFVVCVMLYAVLGVGAKGPQGIMLVMAAMIGGYMAMNIGANDVANNVGPAVGSRSITMTGAIVLAAIFEVAGALIAGGDVVSTIRGGIIKPEAIADTSRFIWVMTAALLAGALWLWSLSQISTWCGPCTCICHCAGVPPVGAACTCQCTPFRVIKRVW